MTDQEKIIAAFAKHLNETFTQAATIAAASLKRLGVVAEAASNQARSTQGQLRAMRSERNRRRYQRRYARGGQTQ